MKLHILRLVFAAALAAACSGMARPAAVQREAPSFKAVAGERVEPRSDRLASITVLHDSGARPRFSPDGSQLVFDRENSDGFYDVYLSDLKGNIIRTLTEGRSGVPQRNNGNARFHPSGRYIVFVSEESEHFGLRMKRMGDPGIGLFSNFRATTPDAGAFWQLTDIPIKQSLRDRTVAQAVVNPVFSPDGSTFVWTERYAGGGNHNWGRWRLRTAAFEVDDGRPLLRNQRVLYTPSGGNYATAMGFLEPGRIIFAGNPDGQHEYGMDQYVLDASSGRVRQLTDTPRVWEEGSCVAPNGQIVYMTNIASRHELDFDDPNWAAQPTERDYYLMDGSGGGNERLTYFNDPEAPEYMGRVITAACDVSRDGRYLAGTIGIDEGGERRAVLRLKTILAEFRPPLR